MAAIVVTAQTPEVLSACRGGTFASCAGVNALLVIGALPHAINRVSGDNVAQAQSPLWGCRDSLCSRTNRPPQQSY
jgi:hypothetical protein